MDQDHIPCSISHCPLHATEVEYGESEHWKITIHYCYEHLRELREGTPLGPVGIDGCRVEVHAKGTETPRIPLGTQSFGPD